MASRCHINGLYNLVTKLISWNMVAAVLIACLIAPPLSQIFCAEGCSGGHCEIDEAVMLCDLDAPATCCEQGSLGDVVSKLAQLAANCQLCGCFSLERSQTFIVSKNSRETDSKDTATNRTSPLRAEQLCRMENIDLSFPRCPRTHDPPLYYRTHALLI